MQRCEAGPIICARYSDAAVFGKLGVLRLTALAKSSVSGERKRVAASRPPALLLDSIGRIAQFGFLSENRTEA